MRFRIPIIAFIIAALIGGDVFAQNNKTSSFCNPSPEDSLYLYIRAYCLNGVDARNSLDTFRLYVERHPYGTHQLGQVLDAISSTLGETAQLSHAQKKDFIENYNWLIKILPANMEASYQYTALATIADNLRQIDLNEAANMWWNISVLYPDTGSLTLCWRNIRSIKSYQKDITQDTTPFHKLTFPLQPIQQGAVKSNTSTNVHVDMSLVPNPAKLTTSAKIMMSDVGIITLEVYDVLGKKIKVVFHGYTESRNIPIDTRDLNQGMYYIRLQSSCGIITQKLEVIK